MVLVRSNKHQYISDVLGINIKEVYDVILLYPKPDIYMQHDPETLLKDMAIFGNFIKPGSLIPRLQLSK